MPASRSASIRSRLAFIQTLLTGLVHVIIIYLGARLILTGQGFSVGMLFAFLSFRQTFNERADRLHQSAGPVPPAADCISTASPTSSPPFPRPKPQRRSSSTSKAPSRSASCRSATAPPTSSCCRTSISTVEPGRVRRHHRAVGRRQDHASETAARPAPADLGNDRPRRQSGGSRPVARMARARGRGRAGRPAAVRDDRRQHRVLRSRSRHGEGAGRRHGGAGARRHHARADAVSRAGRRHGLDAVGRAAAARAAGARALWSAAHPRSSTKGRPISTKRPRRRLRT